MTNPTATTIAEANFTRHVKQNPYPGRGLVVGRAADGSGWLMIYWIMGRSAHSRNRRFVADGAVLRTEPVDVSRIDDPRLIIYEAMLELAPIYLVGNGDHVRTIYDTLQGGSTFAAALATREREPDAPHYTPRISAMLDLRTAPGRLTLSLLKANVADPAFTDRMTYCPAPPPAGFGMGLTTYLGDGYPLPSFSGDPLLLPCMGSIDTVLETYWQALDGDNRIAIAVKQIPADAGTGKLVVYNRYG